MPFIVPPAALVGVIRHEWVDPRGIVRDFTFETSPGRHVTRGSTGMGMPPVDIAADKLPFSAGFLVRHVGTQAVELDIPILVRETTYGDLMVALDELRQWFATGDERARTPGYWRVTRPDGIVRQLRCFYAGGLEGDHRPGTPTDRPMVLSLYAPSSYWEDPADVEVGWVQATPGVTWFETPFIWGRLTTSDVFTDALVINSGDVDAYPIWTVTGPGSTIQAFNTTTGQSWTLALQLAEGETITVDCRPASQRDHLPILDGAGNNRRPFLTATSELWTLAAGANILQLAMAATEPASEIEMAYRARYRGVLA